MRLLIFTLLAACTTAKQPLQPIAITRPDTVRMHKPATNVGGYWGNRYEGYYYTLPGLSVRVYYLIEVTTIDGQQVKVYHPVSRSVYLKYVQ